MAPATRPLPSNQAIGPSGVMETPSSSSRIQLKHFSGHNPAMERVYYLIRCSAGQVSKFRSSSRELRISWYQLVLSVLVVESSQKRIGREGHLAGPRSDRHLGEFRPHCGGEFTHQLRSNRTSKRRLIKEILCVGRVAAKPQRPRDGTKKWLKKKWHQNGLPHVEPKTPTCGFAPAL